VRELFSSPNVEHSTKLLGSAPHVGHGNKLDPGTDRARRACG